MDCEFSDPVDYQGNTPGSTIEYFQFREMSCEITPVPTSTPSAPLATQSGTIYVDIASSSALAVGVNGIVFFLWITCAIAILIGSFFIGAYMFRK